MRGYCISYDPIKCDDIVNNLMDDLVNKYGIDKNKLLFHYKRKNDIKTGEPEGKYPGIKDYVKRKKLKIKIDEGKGNPDCKCRGSNGFIVEDIKCNLFNDKNSVEHKILIDLLPLSKKDKFIYCTKNYIENTRRPLKVENGKLKIDKNDINNISDMRIHFNDDHHDIAGTLFNSTEYISQKSTGLVTFINAGVQSTDCLPISDIQNNNIKSEKGKLILKTLGINENAFCDIFNNYHSGNIFKNINVADYNNTIINFNSNIHDKLFEINLKRLIKKSMGDGNSIISHYINGGDKIYRIKDKKIDLISYHSYYGGKLKKGKRIDVEVKTTDMIFKFNIRNKQGGIYPSHLMCDFKYHNDQMLP